MSVTGGPLCAAALLAVVVISLTVVMNSWHFRAHAAGYFPNGTAADVEFDSQQRNALLIHELSERHKEILPFLISSEEGEKVLDESGYFPHRQSYKTDGLVTSLENGVTFGAITRRTGEAGCDSLVAMRAVDVLGSGYTKIVLKVVLSEGQSVALKAVNDQGTDMERCLEDYKDPAGCQELVSFKLKKEIVLLQRLKHPNIIKLQGHCEAGAGAGAGGITAILEQGSPLQMIQLLQSPWEERFRVCLGLVRLLYYLSRSPLGSVALLDFQPRQFVLVSGELKLTDLDDASVAEPVCRGDQDCLLHFPLRTFSLSCSSRGTCHGLNERRNLYNAYRYFFTYLLPHQAPPALKHLVDDIMNSTGELRGDVNDTLGAFEEVLRVYKSGLHLDSLQPALIRDYTVMRGMGTWGDVGYQCWPSYNHQGCLLSVHSAREAASICNSHPRCSSFSLTGQRTWTGRLLASFRSGFSHLVPDGSSEVYLRKTKPPASGPTV